MSSASPSSSTAGRPIVQPDRLADGPRLIGELLSAFPIHRSRAPAMRTGRRSRFELAHASAASTVASRRYPPTVVCSDSSPTSRRRRETDVRSAHW